MKSKAGLTLIGTVLSLCDGFQNTVGIYNPRATFLTQTKSNWDEEESATRRLVTGSILGSAIAMAAVSVFPSPASAGIDVSSLRTEGSQGSSIASQLKAYDGSGSARVREIKSIQAEAQAPLSNNGFNKGDSAESKVAHWAYRANPGVGPILSKAGSFGTLYRYRDQLTPPSGSKRRSIGAQFEFPSDWLQLDKFNGGIQYVDQRNGDKLYVLQLTLPEDTTLETIPKSTIGDLIFSPDGSVVKTGQTIEDYKVVNGQILTQCPSGSCATRRRFKIKYATVTGNGLRVERRALVDAYQLENDVYMLMTSSNAVKFEQKDSRERETVENIVNSFVLDL